MVNSIGVNATKSGVLFPRVDHRTPSPSITNILQIPVVTKYRYLGIWLTDCYNMQLDIVAR
jgi:hypothetical protein